MKSSRGDSENSTYETAITQEAFIRDDYILCDHCSRRFNKNAAERHIPYCKNKMNMEKIKEGGKAKQTQQQQQQTGTAINFKLNITQKRFWSIS